LKPFLRLLGCAACAVLILGVAIAGMIGDVDLGVDAIACEGERGHQLDRALFRCQARAEVIDHLIQELAAEELSLAEATQQGREAYEGDDGAVFHLRAAFGGDTDDEVFSRHLVVRVAKLLWRSPERYGQVLPRLEAELKQIYPLTKTPVVDRDSWPMQYRREGGADWSRYDSVDHGF
jgi:hypothetical protein